MEDDKKRRRNCADRARYELQRRQARKGRTDPAMAVFLQLLAVAGLALRLLPDFSSPAVSLPSPTSRVPLPVPDAVPFERYKGAPSWPRLVKDLARPAATEDAQRELRSRLPPECSCWLDHVVREAAWSDVRIHVQSGTDDAEITASLVAEARRWESQRKADRAQALAELKVEAEGGGAASAAKPGAGTPWERKR
jgi:hypothetical protein